MEAQEFDVGGDDPLRDFLACSSLTRRMASTYGFASGLGGAGRGSAAIIPISGTNARNQAEGPNLKSMLGTPLARPFKQTRTRHQRGFSLRDNTRLSSRPHRCMRQVES